MSRINRLANGFLAYLGTQSLGDNPSQLEDSIRATVDLSRFYESLLVKQRLDALPSAPGGLAQNYTVPQGKVWMPLRASMQTQTVSGSADFCRFAIFISRPPGGLSGTSTTGLVKLCVAYRDMVQRGETFTGGVADQFPYRFPGRIMYGSGTTFEFVWQSTVFTSGNPQRFVAFEYLEFDT